MRMFYMVSYDITANDSRRRVQKILEGFGERVQYSVFECAISESQYKRLTEKIASTIDKESDSVRYYRMCNGCRKNIEFYGAGQIMEDDYFFMV
jgi:CRISPR-associated protein Cas2